MGFSLFTLFFNRLDPCPPLLSQKYLQLMSDIRTTAANMSRFGLKSAVHSGVLWIHSVSLALALLFQLGFCVCAMTKCSCLVITTRPLQALLILSLTWRSVCYIWLKSQQIRWKILTEHLEGLYMDGEVCLNLFSDLTVAAKGTN